MSRTIDKMIRERTRIEHAMASAPANVKPRAVEHTKGLWLVHTSGSIYAGASYVATTVGEDEQANARRIVACVNALEGVPDDEVEAAGAGLRHHFQLIDQLRAREKELVEALEGMLALFDDEGNFREEFQDQASVADEKARAALSKVRGA